MASESDGMSITFDEEGTALTETQDGVTMPAEITFKLVNDYVHGIDVHFEELQWLCLGMASEIETLRKDTQRLDFLENKDQLLCNVHAPYDILESNISCLRAVIDDCIKRYEENKKETESRI